jgi:hypothetical protein
MNHILENNLTKDSQHSLVSHKLSRIHRFGDKKSGHIFYLDLKKAFDKVTRKIDWWKKCGRSDSNLDQEMGLLVRLHESASRTNP